MTLVIEQIQVGIFLSAIDASSRLKLASAVIESVPALSDVDPIIVPLSDTSRPEGASIVIRKEQLGWIFTFSQVRIDLLYIPPLQPTYESLSTVMAELENALKPIWDIYERKFGARGSRIGIVVNLHSEVESAVDKFRQKFLGAETGESSNEIQLHLRKSYKRSEFDINQWIRIFSEGNHFGIAIDVNTIAEKSLEKVNIETLENFFNLSSAAISESIDQYTVLQ